MKTRRVFLIALICAAVWGLPPLGLPPLGLPPLAAEESAAEAAGNSAGSPVFAPFVSRLEGELKNNLVRLTWEDSRDVRGPVYVYRSASPFEGTASLRAALSAKPVEIPYGARSFVDEIEAGAVLYYFVAASDEGGRVYDIPISSANTIGIRTEGAASAAAGGAAVPVPAARAPAPGAAGISNVKALGRGDKVIVSFDEGGVKGAALYRSVRPISRTQDLLGASIVQSGISSPFTDSPAPGIPYYYAVIGEEDLVRGTVEIVPGRNATAEPVKAGGTSSDRDMRALPLPEISVQAAVPGTAVYADPPPPAELSPQAAKALDGIPARPRAADPSLKKPRVFARDLAVSPAGGDEYALSSIVKGPFAAKDWEAAREGFAGFLALPRTPETQARARFYLGQCCYFSHRAREGLFEFLAIQDQFPAESAEWIQASLDMMKE